MWYPDRLGKQDTELAEAAVWRKVPGRKPTSSSFDFGPHLLFTSASIAALYCFKPDLFLPGCRS